MIFNDEVTVSDPDAGATATVAAYVGNATTLEITSAGAGASFAVSEVRAMVPLPFYDLTTGQEYSDGPDPDKVRGVTWRGRPMTVQGAPMLSRVRGEDHHVTYRLRGIA